MRARPETHFLDFVPGVYTVAPFDHVRGRGSLWNIFKGFVDTTLQVSAMVFSMMLSA